MKYSLGLTAVTMVALSGLYIAGCSAAGGGMGILDPYETSSPLEPGHGSSASPTASPTKHTSKEVFQENLTNPTGMIFLTSMSNGIKPYGLQANYWVLQHDTNAGNDGADTESRLVRIAADTEKSKSKTDTNSPHKMILIDVDTREEINLNNPTSLVSVFNPDIKEFKTSSKEVFSPEYNPNQSYLVLANKANSPDSGQIIIINPNEDKNNQDTLFAKVLYTSAKQPISIAADQKYIWWVECKVDAAVMRMDYTSKPDDIASDAWRVRTYTAGLQYPEFIMTNGNTVYVADTGGNRVFIGPRIIEEKEQEKSTAQICEYATNENDGYYLLEAGFHQPYALTLLNNGKLLIADGSANPLYDSNDAPKPLNGNMGNLYIWDVKNPQDRRANEKLGVNVALLCEGLNNPMMIAPVYDATNDTSSKNAQYADLIIPQYSTNENMSHLGIVRVDTNFRKTKLIKENNFYDTNRTTYVYLLNTFTSTDTTPVDLPERTKGKLQILYNEGIKNPVNYKAVIQYYNDNYPF